MQRTRLIYRMMIYRRRKNEPKGFTETDYARLLDAAHQQLGGPSRWAVMNAWMTGSMVWVSALLPSKDCSMRGTRRRRSAARS